MHIYIIIYIYYTYYIYYMHIYMYILYIIYIQFTGKFVYTAHHFILLRLHHFDLRIDRGRWWFEHCAS